MSKIISNESYAAMYGPTTGDRVRLADTDIIIEVEKDLDNKKIKKIKSDGKTNLKKSKKSKILGKKIKNPRTLWVRRKKRAV